MDGRELHRPQQDLPEVPDYLRHVRHLKALPYLRNPATTKHQTREE
jgi:hypothetical protein